MAKGLTPHDMMGWVNSTVAARLYGYVGGYGSAAQLTEEIDSLRLSTSVQKHLWQEYDGLRSNEKTNGLDQI